MAKTKVKPKKKIDYLYQSKIRKDRIGVRIEAAIDHARQSAQWLAKELGLNPKHVDDWLIGATEPGMEDLLWIVAACDVDARWLATGVISPAANAALQMIDESKLWPVGTTIHPDGLMAATQIRNLVSLTPQPMVATGICRYCLCVDERACEGGCGWVDEDHTICSACLDPERIHAE